MVCTVNVYHYIVIRPFCQEVLKISSELLFDLFRQSPLLTLLFKYTIKSRKKQAENGILTRDFSVQPAGGILWVQRPCKGAALTNTLVVLRRILTNNLRLFHFDPEMLPDKIDRRENR